jgi:TPR repeat protein
VREAELWYRRAAQAGNADAMNNLGSVFERRGDVDPAMRWYRRAAEAGDVRGMTNLAHALDRRGETDQAEHWHRLADPDWMPRRSPPGRR